MAAANKTDTFSKMVKDNCSCPICFEEFEEPRSLPSCCHSFCERCLQKLLKPPSAYSPQPNIQCPLCQRVSPVVGGVSSLPVNPILKELLEHTPAAKARKELNGFLDQCFLELQKATTEIETIAKHTDELIKHIETQKELVNQAAKKLKEDIDKKANEVLQDLDLKAARQVESARECELEGVLCCSDTEAEYKRFREMIKNEYADEIMDKKILYLRQLEDLKTNVCERTSTLVAEAKDRLGGTKQRPRFIPNLNLKEAVAVYDLGVLDTEERQVCEEPDIVPDEDRRPNRTSQIQADANGITFKKITYTREFLLKLRNHPASLVKPEGLPDFICASHQQDWNKQKFKKNSALTQAQFQRWHTQKQTSYNILGFNDLGKQDNHGNYRGLDDTAGNDKRGGAHGYNGPRWGDDPGYDGSNNYDDFF